MVGYDGLGGQPLPGSLRVGSPAIQEPSGVVGVTGLLGLGVPDHDQTAGILLHALTLACPSLAVMSRGPLIIIGGAEDKLRRRTILTEFVGAAGGEEARIAIIATASSLGPEVVEVYDALFRKLGAAEVVSVRPETREQAHDHDLVAEVDKATGVFMTGGNQLKLSAVICGTPFGDALVDAHQRGVVVAGTSAGASIQSSHMVAFGGPGSTPKQRMTQVAAGLGLLESCVIDQHFDQRNRYGRLLMIVSESPSLLGIGVDEDTAAVVEEIEGHEVLRVVGKGAVTIFDPAQIVTNAYEAKRSSPLLASGVVLHVLPHGSRFDMTTRTLIPPPRFADPAEAAEMVAAGKDLGRLARDIAADEVSPSALRRRRARSRRKTEHPHPDGASS
jgi:cyanophycinase